MEQETIIIKGMVCQRCMMVVEKELRMMGYTPLKLSLGEVSFNTNTPGDSKDLKEKLLSLGFSLPEDKMANRTKKLKELIQEVYNGDFDFPMRFRFSQYAEKRLATDYDSISSAFIQTENKTVEQYIIEYRINKIKELLVYSGRSLSDIAFSLNFSSVSHLSAQFKQQTGLTCSFFKNVHKQKLKASFSEN
ncbi:MAG: helix-turn-helix domain-containing protein [Ginsengibacter sp.]